VKKQAEHSLTPPPPPRTHTHTHTRARARTHTHRSLDLSGNRLSDLPLSLTSSDFPSLEDLILDHNDLDSLLPFQALALLPRLTFLSLSRNRIDFIPRLVDGGGGGGGGGGGRERGAAGEEYDGEDEESAGSVGAVGGEMSGGEMSGGGRMGSGSMSTVPFASLETLCVTDNRIEVAADVLNAALITSLRSLLSPVGQPHRAQDSNP
jgi:Leucine-rich repeat (LRR) protein